MTALGKWMGCWGIWQGKWGWEEFTEKSGKSVGASEGGLCNERGERMMCIKLSFDMMIERRKH